MKLTDAHREEWLRASSRVAQVVAAGTGLGSAFNEAASMLQGFGPLFVSIVASSSGGSPESYVFGFSANYAERLKSLYSSGYRLVAPIKGASELQSDHVLWPELALEGVAYFSAWPLQTAGRTVGELHVGVPDAAKADHLPPDEFMETFAGALALAVDRNALLDYRHRREETFAWHRKMIDALVNNELDAVCITDSLGRVLLLNPAGERMLDLREGQVLGRRFHDVDPRFSPVGSTEDALGSDDERAVFVLNDALPSCIEGMRVAIFEHNSKSYFVWRLLETTRGFGNVGGGRRNTPASLLMNNERLAVFSCDLEGRIVSSSVNLPSMLGMPKGETGQGDRIDDSAVMRSTAIADAVRRCLSSGKPEVSSHEIFHRLRGIIHLTLHCSPILHENAELIGVQAVVEDATDMVRTRTSLMRSEERYRIFFNNAPIALIEVDMSSAFDHAAKRIETMDPDDVVSLVRVSAVNPAAAAMYKASSAAELMRTWSSLHLHSSAAFRDLIQSFMLGNMNACVEVTCTTLDGAHLHTAVNAAVAPGSEQNLSRVMMSIVDITQIKSMEQALRTQLALERLVSRISARFVSLEPEKTEEGIAGAVEEIALVLKLDMVAVFEPLGDVGLNARYIWTPEEMDNLPIVISSLLSMDFPMFADAIRAFQVVRMDKTADLPEICNERFFIESLGIASLLMIPLVAQGRLRGVLALAAKEENRWCDENVALLRVMADVAADALDREQRESAKQESEDLLRTVFQTMVGGLLVTDQDGRVLLANPSAASSFKLADVAGLIGRCLHEAVPGAEGMLRSSAPGEQQQIVLTLNDGSKNTFGFTNAAAVSGRRIILFRDLSPLIEIAKRQKRAEELARLGMVAAKLSHEIKNPLASMLLGLTSLEESTALGDEELFVLRSVLDEVRYLKSFVGNLLDTTRLKDVAPKYQAVSPILRNVFESSRRRAERRGVSLRLSEIDDDAALFVDADAMGRALLNLVANAVDACSQGDLVVLGIRRLDPEERAVRFAGFSGEVICLYVEDTGPGMPKEVIDNLFVPFTTTKTFGNGLGLSIVRETVTGHGGVVELITPTCRAGGTRFEILLPFGKRPSCLDVHGKDGTPGCGGCPVPTGCPVCEVDGHYSCWVIKGKASLAESGKWKDECIACPAFLAGNLEHYHVGRATKREGL